MDLKLVPLAVALTLSACTATDNGQQPMENTLDIVVTSDKIIDENAEVDPCGPSDLLDKMSNIPQAGYFGVNRSSGNVYYPSSKNFWVRGYSMGQVEKDLIHMAAATADYWNPYGQYYRVNTGADASIHFTTSDGPLYPACDKNYTGGSDDCWFAGTSCVAYTTTNQPGVRLCTDWKIQMNWPSMYLYADSRGIPRENIVIATGVHEMGHALGLAHRNSTIMAPSIPLPGTIPFPHWDDIPRYDACQLALLQAFYVDETGGVLFLDEPVECQ